MQTDKTHTENKNSEDVSKTELVYELDPTYTNLDFNVPLTSKAIPTITSDNEAEIYGELIQGSLIPRYMVLEASVYPIASMGTFIKSHSPSLYQQGEIGHSGINVFESATADFQEPWAVSAFFGNVAKLNRPKEQREGNNYGYTGYLFSAGDKHIKNNLLIPDDWYEFEWKIKGKIDYPDEKLSWSFRVGARFNSNKGVNDVTYVSLHRSNLDLRYSFLEWLENANYDLRMYFLQQGGQMVRTELIAGKKVPMPEWGYAPTLDIGFVWSSPNEYAGPLRDIRGNTTTLIFRPSIEF
ncbi:hypothetical protein MIZ01_1770 [Sideroxyarcus emersonii]|uniref:Uncharacterized protein n=1 Tax=Sideroxyarcus emersonii TaxID=2764705 RepID=A0AAN1XAV7_9PROT|nr:hypothetical protein MIZ01_1770 [Sideroxyarcus emersonii]